MHRSVRGVLGKGYDRVQGVVGGPFNHNLRATMANGLIDDGCGDHESFSTTLSYIRSLQYMFLVRVRVSS